MQPIIVTSQETINDAIRVALDAALKEHLTEAVRRATQKAFLTKPELMELTGWSSRQVEYKKTKREIPYIRRGRLILFPTEGVYAYLDKGFVPARKK
ncbi:MAG: hypothetical protein AAF391_14020 [Bacteroidota bacterium]